ncbi:RNA-binding domain-containing protein [Ramaria rubella]|nr:RNA-binding domain-containing protein [Ramaria rubella]
MTRRLYLGRLPHDVRQEEVTNFLDGYGRIVDCRVMTGFGFVEFESSKDAEEVVANFNGKTFLGAPIVVEFAKEGRSRPREPYDDRGGYGYPPPRSRRPPGVRLIVSGISRDTSWQDLKDFGREAGSVSFADIDRDVPGQGILEYLTRDDADAAVKTLDGKDLRGQPVRVAPADDPVRGASNSTYVFSFIDFVFSWLQHGPPDYRRDDRYKDDRYERHDRYRDPPPRRERSRSPYRRDYDRYDDRRARSPRRDGDDRRYYDDRRDSRRDDRRDLDDRRNGDGGWHRSSR